MRKLCLFSLILMAIIVLVSGCAAPEAPTDETSVSPEPTEGQPVYGGTLKLVAASGPRSMSYRPEMGLLDHLSNFPAVEKLMDASDDRYAGYGLEPVLAESVDDDIPNKRIVFHLRSGVKFHDGSDLNADAVIWKYEQALEKGGPQYRSYWKGIQKIDDTTVQIEYTEYSNQLLPSWSLIPIFSKAAWEQASGGDPELAKDWARTHVVGAGPFILKEFKRDDHLTWIKNPDYWRPGKPYLDAIEVIFIPDPVTAQALMEKGEADYWFGPPVRNQIYLEELGMVRISRWVGTSYSIWPNTADPNSKWNDIRLRQAIEYALDKPAIAKALGLNYYKPMTTLAPEGEWGYVPDYPGREHNPAKARQLLAEAGYADCLNAKLLIANDADSLDAGATLKGYLDAAGFNIELDVADPGRYYSTVWGREIPAGDLVCMWSGMDANYLVTYMRYFSTTPLFKCSYLGYMPEQAAMDEAAMKISDAAGQEAMTVKLINYLADNSRVIPVYWAPFVAIIAPYVHQKISGGTIRWQTEEVWMEEH